MSKPLQFPSTDLGYEYVKLSYDWAIGRYESVMERAYKFQVFAGALLAGVTALAVDAKETINLLSPWFIVAAVAFAVALLCGVIAGHMGSIKLPNPAIIHDSLLKYDEKTFKRYMLYYSGKHFAHNLERVNDKWVAISVMNVAIAVELILLAVWLWRG